MANTHSRTIARARALHSTRATAHSRGRRLNDGTSSRATSGSHTQCTSVPPGAHLHMMCQRVASPLVRGTEARWPNRRVALGPQMARVACCFCCKPDTTIQYFEVPGAWSAALLRIDARHGAWQSAHCHVAAAHYRRPQKCSAPLEHAVASSRARAGNSDPLLQMPVAFDARCVMHVAAPGDWVTTGQHTFSRARAQTRAPPRARHRALIRTRFRLSCEMAMSSVGLTLRLGVPPRTHPCMICQRLTSPPCR